MTTDIYETLAHWREKLTGVRATTTGTTLEDGAEALLRWNARRLVSEQMLVIETATFMLQHKMSIGDLSKYLGSPEIKKKPLGRLGIVTGLRAWVKRIGMYYLPILRSGAYRPFLQPEVVRAMMALQKTPGMPPGLFDLGVAADTFYRGGTSPFAAVASLKAIRSLASKHPDSVPQMLEALGLARQAALQDIADLEEADAVAASFAPQEDAVPVAEPEPPQEPAEVG